MPVREPERHGLRDGHRWREDGDGEFRPIRVGSDAGEVDQLLRERECVHQTLNRQDRAAGHEWDAENSNEGVPLE